MTVAHWIWWMMRLLRWWRSFRIWTSPMESAMSIGLFCSRLFIYMRISWLSIPVIWYANLSSIMGLINQLCIPSKLSTFWTAECVSSKTSPVHFLQVVCIIWLANWRVRKLVTTIVSTFTAHYIFKWDTYFPGTPLEPPYLPSFDGRAVVYPTIRNLRDYMSWRQVDCKFFYLPWMSLAMFLWHRCLPICIIVWSNIAYAGHINNLYNTTFWTMVQKGGMSNTDAELELKVTLRHRYLSYKRLGYWRGRNTREPYLRTKMRSSLKDSGSIIITSPNCIKRVALFTVR